MAAVLESAAVLEVPHLSQPSMTELVGRLQRDVLHLQRPLHGRVIELLQALPAEDQATLNLATRAASPLINPLTQLAAYHPSSFGGGAPSTN